MRSKWHLFIIFYKGERTKMKNLKNCVRILVAVSLLALMMLPSFAVQEALITQDEACGENATWELQGTTLYIHGTGAMNDYSDEETPWYTFSSKIKSLVIDEGISEIGDSAFKGTGIVKVSLPSSLTRIGERAFYDSKVATINLPEGLETIDEYAFGYCYKLKKIILPESLTTIGEYAFYSCHLADVTLPEGLTAIPRYAFSYNKFKSITIPEGVETLEESCFSGSSLTSIDLPASLETIETNVFNNCKKLKKVSYAGNADDAHDISIEEGNTYLSSASWTYADGEKSVLETASDFCGELATWEVKGNVLTISGTGAIDDYSEKEIPWIIYKDKLKSVVINEGITEIGDKAFYGLKIGKVQLPSTLKKIGASAFANTYLTTLQLPNGLEEIGEDAFYWCYKLFSISIPDSVTTIGSDAFYYCKKAGSLKISANVTTLENGTFRYVSAKEVTIPEGVTTIGDQCFESAGVTTLNLPSTLESIGEDAFSECAKLKTVNYAGSSEAAQKIAIESGNTFVTSSAWNCTDGKLSALEAVSCMCGEAASWEVKKNTLYISGTGAMADFNQNETPWYTLEKSIKAVVVEEGITSIGNYSFDGLKITKAQLPSTLERIGANAFSNTRIAAIKLPDGLKTIESHAFYWCSKIKELSIPDTVTAIGEYAFYYCNRLTKLKLSAGVEVLDSYAFYSCNVKDLVIPEGVTTIEKNCFCYCDQMGTVTLPSTLEFIGENAFDRCKKIKKVNYAASGEDATAILIESGNSYLTSAAWNYQ